MNEKSPPALSQPILSAGVARDLLFRSQVADLLHLLPMDIEFIAGDRSTAERVIADLRAALAYAPAAPPELCPVYSWLSKVSKAERGYTGSAAHHLMNYYEGAESAPPAAPAAPLLTDAERKLLDAAKVFAKEHIEGDALHDDDDTPDEVVHASDARYCETKRLLCDAYLEVLASMSADAQSKGRS